MKKQLGLSLATGLALLAIATPAFAASISTQMNIGARGADVTTLQQTLAADSTLYPEGTVSGYFGALTSAAVKRFQAKYGIVSSGSPSTTGYGRVGPATIAKFNAVYGNGTASTDGAPIIMGVTVATSSVGGATMMWNTNEPATGVIYYSTAPLQLTEASGPGQAPGISGTNVQTVNAALNTSNSVALSGLASSSTYYYTIKSTDASGNISLTWPASFVAR
jgi:peptidoglycan hydrolase-like protein with peptidoglycan-binding domain